MPMGFCRVVRLGSIAMRRISGLLKNTRPFRRCAAGVWEANRPRRDAG